MSKVSFSGKIKNMNKIKKKIKIKIMLNKILSRKKTCVQLLRDNNKKLL